MSWFFPSQEQDLWARGRDVIHELDRLCDCAVGFDSLARRVDGAFELSITRGGCSIRVYFEYDLLRLSLNGEGTGHEYWLCKDPGGPFELAPTKETAARIFDDVKRLMGGG